MRKYEYAYEKLLGAIDIMATGKGSRQDRLETATLSFVMRIQPNDLPEELRPILKAFMDGMTARPDPYGHMGDVAWTKIHMHWRSAEKLANQLFQMFVSVSNARHERKPE